jgi:hypothetical protein
MSAAPLTSARVGDLRLTRAAEPNLADLSVLVAQLEVKFGAWPENGILGAQLRPNRHRPKTESNRRGPL